MFVHVAVTLSVRVCVSVLLNRHIVAYVSPVICLSVSVKADE